MLNGVVNSAGKWGEVVMNSGYGPKIGTGKGVTVIVVVKWSWRYAATTDIYQCQCQTSTAFPRHSVCWIESVASHASSCGADGGGVS